MLMCKHTSLSLAKEQRILALASLFGTLQKKGQGWGMSSLNSCSHEWSQSCILGSQWKDAGRSGVCIIAQDFAKRSSRSICRVHLFLRKFYLTCHS